MTSIDSLPQLRVDVPTLEPDAALLARLVDISSSTPARTTSRASSAKVLLVAASVALIAAVTWLVGALPGTSSPIIPAHHPHQPAVIPTAPPSPHGAARPRTRAPGVPNPTRGTPGATHSTSDAEHSRTIGTASPPDHPAGTRPGAGHTGHAKRHHHRLPSFGVPPRHHRHHHVQPPFPGPGWPVLPSHGPGSGRVWSGRSP
jgi:hypothetical protein